VIRPMLASVAHGNGPNRRRRCAGWTGALVDTSVLGVSNERASCARAGTRPSRRRVDTGWSSAHWTSSSTTRSRSRCTVAALQRCWHGATGPTADRGTSRAAAARRARVEHLAVRAVGHEPVDVGCAAGRAPPSGRRCGEPVPARCRPGRRSRRAELVLSYQGATQRYQTRAPTANAGWSRGRSWLSPRPAGWRRRAPEAAARSAASCASDARCGARRLGGRGRHRGRRPAAAVHRGDEDWSTRSPRHRRRGRRARRPRGPSRSPSTSPSSRHPASHPHVPTRSSGREVMIDHRLLRVRTTAQ